MSKKYGLILPSNQKKPVPANPKISRPSIFDESSDSDDGKDKPRTCQIVPSALQRQLARSQQEKALQEDPTIYQYDEVFEEIEAKRELEKEIKSNEPKKPKYIARLIESAERRKIENERRIERQVQLEREQEGDEFKDKESFVTAAYRKKLEEMRKVDLEEKRDDYLETIGDVTKQKNLDGFYRHLYELKVGGQKEVKKPELLSSSATTTVNSEGLSYQPIKSLKTQQRAYRKRCLTAMDEEEEEQKEQDQLHQTDKTDTSTTVAKRTHLQNNIDADSDFSIDSSSDEEEQEDEMKKNSSEETKSIKQQDTKNEQKEMPEGNGATSKEESSEIKINEENKENKNNSDEMLETTPPAPPKRDKSEIWKKRTVGEVFDAAVKRYYERKAARSV